MLASVSPELQRFSSSWLQRQLAPDVLAMAEVVRASHADVEAVLAYGSCLRGVDVGETLIDYYVLTSNLGCVSPSALAQLGCRMLPPNVYYREAEVGGRILRAKYAVLPIGAFTAWAQPATSNPYFWARFAQPAAIAFVRDEQAAARVSAAIASAIFTCYGNAKALSPGATDALAIWAAGFRATYATELRSERENRADQIVSAYSDYYREAARLLEPAQPIAANWAARRLVGKLLSVLRLVKASFTFQGGADYLAWKIERHSGVSIELTDWQRRHPVLAGPWLLLKLRRNGAVK